MVCPTICILAMLKKVIIFILPFLIGAGSIKAFSTTPQPDPLPTENVIGKQIVAEPQIAPSEEVNYVEESEIARKMQQAKKAKNAKEYDSFGGGITIIAMCIVVGALIVLSILFYIFGHISSWFISHKKKQTKIIRNNETGNQNSGSAPDTGDVIAAISAALAQHFATDHDMQDTILTIRRMRKAYSPWNSKIYNMRQLPEVAHNHPKLGK